MNEKLIALSKRMKDEQRQLLLSAADHDTMPSNSTVQRVAMLELNIAASRTPWRTRNPDQFRNRSVVL
jgi:hypothetical protein